MILEVLWIKMLFAGAASVGFSIFFTAPRRALLACFFCGAIGYMARFGSMEFLGLALPGATFVGALSVGFLAEPMARLLKMPTSVFKVSGVLPLLPGRMAFDLIVGLLSLSRYTGAIPIESIEHSFRMSVLTGLVMLGLVGGITLPALFFYKRPVIS